MQKTLRQGRRDVRTLVTALLMSVSVAGAVACGPPRVYDPYYHDYHYWNHDEIAYYNTWEQQTNRPHVEFKARTADDQHAYFDWRHAQHK